MKMRTKLRLPALAMAFILMFSGTGCVQRNVEGTMTTYHYPPWVGMMILAGGLAVVPLGWKLRKNLRDFDFLDRILLTIMFICPIIAVGYGPNRLVERVRVDDDHLERTTMWLSKPQTVTIGFDQLAQIHRQREVKESTGRRGQKRTSVSNFLLFLNKDGTSEKIYFNDVILAAAPELISRAAARGVTFVDMVEAERQAAAEAFRIHQEKQLDHANEVLRAFEKHRNPPVESPDGTGDGS